MIQTHLSIKQTTPVTLSKRVYQLSTFRSRSLMDLRGNYVTVHSHHRQTHCIQTAQANGREAPEDEPHGSGPGARSLQGFRPCGPEDISRHSTSGYFHW